MIKSDQELTDQLYNLKLNVKVSNRKVKKIVEFTQQFCLKHKMGLEVRIERGFFSSKIKLEVQGIARLISLLLLEINQRGKDIRLA